MNINHPDGNDIDIPAQDTEYPFKVEPESVKLNVSMPPIPGRLIILPLLLSLSFSLSLSHTHIHSKLLYFHDCTSYNIAKAWNT